MRTAAALAGVALVALALGGPGAGEAAAHSGLVRSQPAAGAALGASPAAVVLTLSERPAPSLSSIRVLDSRGVALQTGPPAGDGPTLTVALRALRRGVYSVSWRAVSAIDGHVSAGAFAFGIGATPTGAAARATTTSPGGEPLEMLGRWLLLAGLIALLGAAAAGVTGFGGAGVSTFGLGLAGWMAAAVGLVLLFDAQRRSAGASLHELLGTDVGRALVWRAVAIHAAGIAVLLAWRLDERPRAARVAFAAAGVAAAGAVAVHVAAGHAGAGTWPTAISAGSQWAHVVAAGVWIGGLAALLLGLRGAGESDRSAAVRRFAIVAAGGIGVVAIAGTLRAVDELTALGELTRTGYGRAVLAKIALLVAIAALAARSRRGLKAGSGLAPLWRRSRAELSLATVALVLAALLGSIAPPVSGAPGAPGLSAAGADFATTLRVRLTAASAQAGANRFVARVSDYDSGAPVRGARVRLRFDPLDDPGVDATSLALSEDGDGSYAGSGANLTFDGRWRVTVLVQRARDSVEMALELDVPGPEHFITVQRAPGRAPTYSAQVIGAGYVRISAQPERAGQSTVAIDVFTVFEDFAAVDDVVLTSRAGGARPRQWPVRPRRDKGRFVADVVLARGANTIAVVARDRGGMRMRAVFELDVPGSAGP
jgi:copper transport protein